MLSFTLQSIFALFPWSLHCSSVAEYRRALQSTEGEQHTRHSGSTNLSRPKLSVQGPAGGRPFCKIMLFVLPLYLYSTELWRFSLECNCATAHNMEVIFRRGVQLAVKLHSNRLQKKLLQKNAALQFNLLQCPPVRSASCAEKLAVFKTFKMPAAASPGWSRPRCLEGSLLRTEPSTVNFYTLQSTSKNRAFTPGS